MKKTILILSLALSGCAAAPKLNNAQTASDRFASLGYHDKWVAHDFYNLGQGDVVKRQYWMQRNYQAVGGISDRDAIPKLQRTYLNVPTPAYQDADGTRHDEGLRAVEIVQLWDVVQKPGHKLFIVK
jgi:hypothetical protein